RIELEIAIFGADRQLRAWNTVVDAKRRRPTRSVAAIGDIEAGRISCNFRVGDRRAESPVHAPCLVNPDVCNKISRGNGSGVDRIPETRWWIEGRPARAAEHDSALRSNRQRRVVDAEQHAPAEPGVAAGAVDAERRIYEEVVRPA